MAESLFTAPDRPSLFAAPDRPSLFAGGPQPGVNWSPLTPVKGFIGGLGRLAQGITGLVAAGAHDVFELGAEVLPGHQAIEDDGYRLAAIGRAFVPSLKSDYAKRYGGLSNIARGLWEDPLSYISDALLVAGGVGAVAKMGRAGSILSKLPTVMSETTAAKVLGATAETGWRATLEVANPSLKAGVVEKLPLSANPATRFLQTKAAEALSLPVTKTEFMSLLDQPEFIRAQGVVQYAANNGIRVLRPSVGKVLAGRRAGYVLSKLKVASQDLGQGEKARIEAAVARADDPEIAAAYLRGNATPVTPGKFDPIPLEGDNSTALPNATRMNQNATVEVPDATLPLSHVEAAPGRPPVVMAGPGADVPFDLGNEFGENWLHTNINTPHDPLHVAETGDEVTRGIPHTYTILVDSMDNAPLAAEKALAAAKLRPIGVRNYLMDDSVAYDGYHVIAQAEDGAIVDLSIATKDLHEAQLANSHLIEHMDDVDLERADTEAALAEAVAAGTPESIEESVRLADTLKDIEYEAQATDALGRDLFRGHRLNYWAEHGEIVDPNFLAAEALQPVTFDAISSRWMKGNPRAASIYMERAYLEQRLFKFYQMLSDTKRQFEGILGGAGPLGTSGARKALDVEDIGGGRVRIRGWHSGSGLPDEDYLFHFGTWDAAEARAASADVNDIPVSITSRTDPDLFDIEYVPGKELDDWLRRQEAENPDLTFEPDLDPDGGFGGEPDAEFYDDTMHPVEFEGKVYQLDSPIFDDGTPQTIRQDIIDRVRAEGYDAIAYKNAREAKGSTSFMVLNPTSTVKRARTVGKVGDTIMDSGGPPAFAAARRDVTDELAQALLVSGIPKPLVEEMLGARRWWSSDVAAQSAKRADRFVRRMKNTLYDYMVEEGGRGAEIGFPEFDWRVMRQGRLDTGNPLPSYFPNFPNSRPSAALARPRGPVIRTPGLSKKNTGFLLESGTVLEDPAEAYTRAAQIYVNHQEAGEALGQLLDDVGRELSPQEVIDWAGNQYDGEVMVALEHVKQQLSRRAELMVDTLDGISQGKSHADAVKAASEMLHERALTEGLNAIGGSKVFAVPRAVMRQFEKDLAIRFGHSMRVYWDGPLDLWKSAVLSLSPRWIINNVFGNQIFMGIENPGALRGALEQMDAKTAHITKQLFGAYATEVSRGFFSDAQRFGSAIPEDATGILGMMRRVQQMRGSRTLGTLSGKIRHANETWEQAARRGVFINEAQKASMNGWVGGFHSTEAAMKRLLSEGKVTPSVLADALKGVDKTLGDFTRFGVYEQGLLKRFLVPFWGFYRHAAKVLIRMPFEHPLKAKILSQVAEIDAQMHEGEPDWLRSRFRLADFGGDDLMLNVQNWNPLSQFSEQFAQGQSIVGLLNPVVKMVLERQLGVDSYTGEPFRTPDDVIQTWNGSYYKMNFDGQGNYIGVSLMSGPPLPSLAAHTLGMFPQLQFFPQFQRYPKSTLLQFASMLGAPLSQIDLEGTIQRQAEAQASAETTAQHRIGGDSLFSAVA